MDAVNPIDAAARGASDGLTLALNVGAMLISFLALIALVNALMGLAGLSLQQIFGWVFSPIAWAMGVPTQDITAAGGLMGTKMVLNEFVAYLDLTAMQRTAQAMSPKGLLITSFALCGFANFSSIAIQVGGIGELAPMRRADLAKLGFKALICGTLASYLSATLAGLLSGL